MTILFGSYLDVNEPTAVHVVSHRSTRQLLDGLTPKMGRLPSNAAQAD